MSPNPPPDPKIELGELHENEAMLIQLIRTKYRFGEITITTRDGLPMDILKTVERTRVQLAR